MITKCFQKVEYRGHLLTETIRWVDSSSEVVRLPRWEVSYVDAFGVEVPVVPVCNAHDQTEAKQKVDARLLAK
ncbi:hypothetical protein LBMAG52_30570 [Planctomycetia bacterium]|nr:hypothetical protein LBMAG52_30570 [Planctomycetia bacterium]